MQTGGSQLLSETGGNLTVDDGGQLSGGFASSGGTLDAANGLLIQNGFSLGAAAALLSDGRAVVIENTASGAIAGTLGGAGEIDIENGTYTIAAGAVIDPGTLGLYNNSTVTLAENVSDDGTFTIGGGNGPDLNGNTLTLGGAAFLDGGVAGPGVLLVTGTAEDDGFEASAGVTFDDAGTVLQLGGGAPTIEGALLTIESGATWDILTDTPITDSGTLGTIANAGLFEKVEVYGTTQIYDLFVNTGTLLVGAGGLVGTYPTLALYDGGTLDGTLAGAGELDLDSGTYDLGPTAFTIGRFGIFNGSQATLTASASYAGGFDLGYGSGLTLGGQTLTLTGAQDLLVGGIAGTGEVIVQGSADAQYLLVEQGATLDDAGLITQDVQITVDNALLLVASTATYDLIVDNGIGNLGTLGTIDNLGLFEKTDDTGDSNISAWFVNSGTLDVVRGTIAMYSGGLLDGTIEGAGELDLRGGAPGQYTLASGAVLSVATLGLYDGGTSLLLAGDASYGGRLILGSAGITMGGYTLTLTGTASTLSYYNINDGEIDVAGTADINNETVEDYATLAVAGLVTQDGQITVGNTSTDNSAITVDPSGTYDILTDNGIGANGTATVANAGLFEKTGGDGQSSIYAAFDNTGTLDVARGTIALYGGGQLGGTIEGAGELDLRGGTPGQYTLAAGAVVSVATLALYDGGSSLLLAGDATYDGRLILGSAGISMGGYTLTLTGTASTLSYYNINDGVIDVTGTANIGNETIEANATLQDSGLVTQDSYIQLGNTSTDSNAITVASGATYDLLDDAYVYSEGTAAIDNAGLFVKTGVGYESYIEPAFTNTGTLEIDRGTLTLAGGGTLGGSIDGAGTLELSGGTADPFTLSDGVALSVANLLLEGDSSTLFVGGNVSYAGTLSVEGGTISLGGNTLTLSGTDRLGIPDYYYYYYDEGVIADGRVVVTGSADISAFTLEAAATIEDAGVLTEDGGVQLGVSTTDSAALVIDAGATFALLNDSDISVNGTAVIANAGLFEAIGAGGLVAAAVVNTGTLLAAAGTLVLDGGGTLGGTLTGAGALELEGYGSADQFTLAASAVINVASLQDYGDYGLLLGGDIDYAGNFWMDGGTLTLAGFTLTLGGAATLDGSVAGPGTVALNGGTIEYLTVGGGATLVDTGTLLQDSELSLGTSASDTAALEVNAGATYDIVQDEGISSDGTVAIGNAGLFEKTGITGESDIAGPFTNTGTVLAATGTLLLDDALNDASGTLSGGAWDAMALGTAATLELAGGAIATDAADIELDGAASGFLAGGMAIEQSLTAIAASGTLGLGDGVAFVTPDTLTDAGLIELAQGTLIAAALTIAAGGTLRGDGTVTDPVNDSTIEASGGDLLISSAVSGSGVLKIDPGATLELGAAAGSGQTVDLQADATLRLDDPAGFAATLENLQGSDSLDFNGTAAIGASIVGDALNVTLTGGTVLDFALLAPVTGLSVSLAPNGGVAFSSPGSGATVPPTVAPATIDFGEAHVGDTLMQALTVTNAATAGAAETLEGSFASHSVGVLASGAISGLGPTQSDTSSLLVGLDTTFPGLHSGTATASFSLDPSGTPLATDTVDVTGTLFALATASAISGGTLNIGPQHVGSVDSGALTLTNEAVAGLYSEGLDAGFAGATGGVETSGSVSLLAAGASSTALGVAFSQTTVGTVTGQVTLALTSDGAGIDTLGTTALATQTLTVVGTLENFATAGLIGYAYNGELADRIGHCLHTRTWARCRRTAARFMRISMSRTRRPAPRTR